MTVRVRIGTDGFPHPFRALKVRAQEKGIPTWLLVVEWGWWIPVGIIFAFLVEDRLMDGVAKSYGDWCVLLGGFVGAMYLVHQAVRYIRRK